MWNNVQYGQLQDHRNKALLRALPTDAILDDEVVIVSCESGGTQAIKSK